MSQVLSEEWQRLCADAISGAAYQAQHAIFAALARYEAPSAIYRPALSIDGDHWCALYGENLQVGVAGFGKSPADAMWDFDKNWTAALAARPSQPGEGL